VSAGQGRGTLPDLVVSQLYTAVVSDILDDLGHRDHVLDPAIRPLGPGEVIAGPANPFLVAEVSQIPAEPYTGEIAALDDVRPGEVILVAAGGSARAACWGELFSTAARARGARGTLIDGYCRDARSIAALGYPVWCRGMLPLDCKGRTAVTAWRQPAVVGGLPVRPGPGRGRRRRGGRRPGRTHRRDHPAGPGQGIEGAPAAGHAAGGQHAAGRL
jgi:regulator of RNase E activity RraA